MKYELMIILKPLLPEDIRAGVQKKISGFIAEGKGEILKTDVWGKKHLAYPIKKHEEGYYIVHQITLAPNKVSDFKRELRLMNDILRFLLSKQN